MVCGLSSVFSCVEWKVKDQGDANRVPGVVSVRGWICRSFLIPLSEVATCFGRDRSDDILESSPYHLISPIKSKRTEIYPLLYVSLVLHAAIFFSTLRHPSHVNHVSLQSLSFQTLYVNDLRPLKRSVPPTAWETKGAY
jgi:hypothetical protein